MSDVIKIYNKRQAAKYIKNGIQPIRLETTDDEDETILYVFEKESTKDVWEQWKHHKL